MVHSTRLHAQLKPANGNVIKVRRRTTCPPFNGISNLATNEINSSSCTNVSAHIARRAAGRSGISKLVKQIDIVWKEEERKDRNKKRAGIHSRAELLRGLRF